LLRLLTESFAIGVGFTSVPRRAASGPVVGLPTLVVVGILVSVNGLPRRASTIISFAFLIAPSIVLPIAQAPE